MSEGDFYEADVCLSGKKNLEAGWERREARSTIMVNTGVAKFFCLRASY